MVQGNHFSVEMKARLTGPVDLPDELEVAGRAVVIMDRDIGLSQSGGHGEVGNHGDGQDGCGEAMGLSGSLPR